MLILPLSLCRWVMPDPVLRLARLCLLMLPCGALLSQARQATFPARPDLVIDAVEEDLSDVRFVAAFPDGTIAVSQPVDGRVLLYSPDGHRKAAVGRPGAGPGEFRTLANLHGFIGDTLWLYDVDLRRFTLVRSDGRMVRSMRVPAEWRTRGGELLRSSIPTPLSLRPDGSFFGRITMLAALPFPREWGRNPSHNVDVFAWVSRTGAVDRPIAIRPGDAPVCGSAPIRRQECPSSWATVGGPDLRIAALEVENDGEAPFFVRVTVIAPSGDTLFVRRLAYPPLRVSADTIAQLRKLRRVNSGAEPRNYKRPVSRLLVGRDGSIWVGFRERPAGVPWIVLNPDGTTRMEFTAPPNVDLMAASAAEVWGTLTDEDGLESVVRYRAPR